MFVSAKSWKKVNVGKQDRSLEMEHLAQNYSHQERNLNNEKIFFF